MEKKYVKYVSPNRPEGMFGPIGGGGGTDDDLKCIFERRKSMDPRCIIGHGEEKIGSNIPLTPIHDMLAKMNELAVDIRENARYIDSSLLPPVPFEEAFPVNEEPDNIHTHIKNIMNELVIANNMLLHVKTLL